MPAKPLSLSDLTTTFKEDVSCESQLEELKRKLDGSAEDEVECEDLFDGAAASATVTEYIIYYVAGFLCNC